MKLISLNVNGIRACVKKGFLNFIDKVDVDIHWEVLGSDHCSLGLVL